MWSTFLGATVQLAPGLLNPATHRRSQCSNGREDHDGAMQEFQMAQRNPQLKGPSLIRIGHCLAAKGLTEMAIENFDAALEACPRMDANRVERHRAYGDPAHSREARENRSPLSRHRAGGRRLRQRSV